MEFKHFRTNLERENDYPKLVRDKIPEIVEGRTGKKTKFRIMGDEELSVYLLKKVEEEAHELAGADEKEHLAEELADLLELIETIAGHNGLDMQEIKKVQREKAKDRGRFKKRILMLEKTG